MAYFVITYPLVRFYTACFRCCTEERAGSIDFTRSDFIVVAGAGGLLYSTIGGDTLIVLPIEKVSFAGSSMDAVIGVPVGTTYESA